MLRSLGMTERGEHGTVTSQDGSQHVKSSFCEGCRIYCTEFQTIEPVKIFDHLIFLIFVQLKYITIWKLLGIIPHSLIP